MRAWSSLAIVALVAIVVLAGIALMTAKRPCVAQPAQVSFDLPITDKGASEMAAFGEGSEAS